MRLLEQKSGRALAVTKLAGKTFLQIDGKQWASSFAFDAFFSLFPLMILFVTVASFFVDRESAGRAIINYVEGYVPLDGEMRARIFGVIAGVIQAREQAGLVALLILGWAALQCFTTLVRVTNRAWGYEEYNWWQLPLRGMALLGVTAAAILIGMAAPALVGIWKSWLFVESALSSWFYAMVRFIVPLLVLFLSLCLFYKLAPPRKTRFAEVWLAAACATVLLQLTESAFAIYLDRFAMLNAVYGVFGGIMALLLWLYLSGCGFIFGACLCAAQADNKRPSTQTNA